MASLKKRGENYYAQYYIGQKQKRISLNTSMYQVAKAKLRQIEINLSKGQTNPASTKTPLAEILTKYINHIRVIKTPKSAQTDIYYLRQIFGSICQALKITSRRLSSKAMKRPPIKQDKRLKSTVIEVSYLEQITTASIAELISSHVQSRGLAPKTANRYREIIMRLINWAMTERNVKMPDDKNPATKVSKYKEKASQIRFLTMPQIDEQLMSLRDSPQFQTMVAMYIYAGLRREEALWLTLDDIDLKSGAHGIIRVQAKTVNGQYWQPKTGKNRAVPISSTLRYYLDRYNPKPSNGRWYFSSPKGYWYDPDNFSSDLARTNKKSNLKWTCLDFRHTFGSQLAMKGESLYKISSLMGNSPEICRKHYAALLPEALTDCVEFGQAPSAQIKIVS